MKKETIADQIQALAASLQSSSTPAVQPQDIELLELAAGLLRDAPLVLQAVHDSLQRSQAKNFRFSSRDLNALLAARALLDELRGETQG